MAAGRSTQIASRQSRRPYIQFKLERDPPLGSALISLL
jgi:hypothetical protein